MITCLGIIGGSGLYNLNGLKNTNWIKIDTPWGDTSDEILSGELNGIQINFIPRHGRGHYHSPSTIPYKQNIFALKKLGVTEILSVSFLDFLLFIESINIDTPKTSERSINSCLLLSHF